MIYASYKILICCLFYCCPMYNQPTDLFMSGDELSSICYSFIPRLCRISAFITELIIFVISFSLLCNHVK